MRPVRTAWMKTNRNTVATKTNQTITQIASAALCSAVSLLLCVVACGP
jgi:hypothetical protein